MVKIKDKIKRLKNLVKQKEKQGEKTEETPKPQDWLEFRGLSSEAIMKKLEKLSPDEMLKIYKKLEHESGFPTRPENYERPVIIGNFMIMWKKKIEQEQLKAKLGSEKAAWIPLTDREAEKIFGSGGGSTGLYDWDKD